jgi:hypothetical protein
VPQLRQDQILWFDTTARLALNEVGFAMLDKNSTAVHPIHAAKVIDATRRALVKAGYDKEL